MNKVAFMDHLACLKCHQGMWYDLISEEKHVSCINPHCEGYQIKYNLPTVSLIPIAPTKGEEA